MRKLPARITEPPELLRSAPAARKAVSDAISKGIFDLKFRSAVYGSLPVREALDLAHHGKCAFCETKIQPVSTPHVEHFRPKAAYIDEDEKVLVKPGYYWLAYSWSNLMLACPSCNGKSYKGNRFPLQFEAARALMPEDDLAIEAPLLIDPFIEDPRDFIRFNGPVAYAVAGNDRGRVTIEVLGLNREHLVDGREEHLRYFFACMNAVAALPGGPEKTELEKIVRFFLSVRGPYTSCLKDALARELL